jgi:hypothetical protein
MRKDYKNLPLQLLFYNLDLESSWSLQILSQNLSQFPGPHPKSMKFKQ